MIHSDSRAFRDQVRTLDPSMTSYRREFIQGAFNKLFSIGMGREILLPAFNYDFTKTLKFDVELDLPQVGRIPREATNKSGWHRSLTPVYSFLSNQSRPPAYLEPFSENSLFADLVSNEGEIILLGVGCERLTFLHHVEHVIGVPYRYEKSFDGKVTQGKNESSFEVKFHVRPHELNIEYDFKRIENYLIDIGAARFSSEMTLSVTPRLAMEGLLNAFEKDSSFLLTQASRIKVSEKLAQLGRPMRLEDFE